jgi:hypothetical protein
MARLSQHSQTASWFQATKTVTLEWFETRRQAEQAEIRAIIKENPLHNISHRRYEDGEPNKIYDDPSLEEVFSQVKNLSTKLETAEKRHATAVLQLDRLSLMLEENKRYLRFLQSQPVQRIFVA